MKGRLMSMDKSNQEPSAVYAGYRGLVPVMSFALSVKTV